MPIIVSDLLEPAGSGRVERIDISVQGRDNPGARKDYSPRSLSYLNPCMRTAARTGIQRSAVPAWVSIVERSTRLPTPDRSRERTPTIVRRAATIPRLKLDYSATCFDRFPIQGAADVQRP